MRYRALDANGDMSFGQGAANFFVNEPAAVAQAVATRLKLWAGEWFLDQTEGTPWSQQILGKHVNLYDAAIQRRILGTPGVTGLAQYGSEYNAATRALSVQARVVTQFSLTAQLIDVSLLPPVIPTGVNGTSPIAPAIAPIAGPNLSPLLIEDGEPLLIEDGSPLLV